MILYFCKMNQPVSITSLASLSPLGHNRETVEAAYFKGTPCFVKVDDIWQARLQPQGYDVLAAIRQDARYRQVDQSVLMAIEVSRRAVAEAGWTSHNFGINFGSSRGATALFEQHHAEFLATGKSPVLASPTTTLGNISSWVSHDLQSTGPEVSHSITCSTALHALLNGIAWIGSGMSDRFLVGGSEAPLTPFTLAQMQAMKIYSKEDEPFPCRALDLEKQRNTMILGEGAAACTLEAGRKSDALAVITGIGYATEPLKHATSISADATCFQRSMKMALGNNPQPVDAIVMHAPGTIAGDMSEFRAIQKVFENRMPALTTNKWQTGHTFGASGLLSLEMALVMLRTQKWLGSPFLLQQPEQLKRILVNAVGFGGNAVSVVVEV